MKIHLEKTDQMVELDGVPARVWTGKTESGIEVQCFIIRVAVRREDDNSEFERELQEQSIPKIEPEAWPTRMLL